ncbi:MAG: hypothetical protein GYA20_00550 [Chloroflexi bacterium]|nr:hypothetical protein [Chloroflexota bacterium]
MDEAERKIHHRRSLRLPGYDYSQPGAYFVTVMTHGRACLFGEVVDGKMILNAAGRIVAEIWNSLPARFPGVELGAWVVMPNHFHGTVEIHETNVGAIHELPLQDGNDASPQQGGDERAARRRMTLPLVMGYFKMNTAKRINLLGNTPGQPVWQRNYYEHIIRNDEDYRLIHLYIEANPARWPEDRESPAYGRD